MHRLTYLLILFVLGTVAFSVLRHQSQAPAASAPQKNTDHAKRINERFPVANYDELDSTDLPKIAKRKRYNDGKLVYSRVEPETVESVFTPEPHASFPALPVAESDVIVVGTIGAGEAHVSENKKNVFSEFTLIAENVLKARLSELAQGSVLTIDRIGGHVKYPNGQRVLYRIFGMNMPQTGARYLFFLTAKHNKEDLSILTGYELTPDGAAPLDEDLPQVRNLAGLSEKDLMQKVRDLIRNSSN